MKSKRAKSNYLITVFFADKSKFWIRVSLIKAATFDAPECSLNMSPGGRKWNNTYTRRMVEQSECVCVWGGDL